MDYSTINKYLAGEASEAEVKEIYNWIELSPENREEFIIYKKIWVLTSIPEKGMDEGWSPSIITQSPRKPSQLLRKYISYAASILVIFGLGMVLQHWISSSKLKNLTYLADTKIEVPKGQMSKIILPDGTRVQLNSESKLIYSSAFQSGNRTVTLEGEAFFDVAKDVNHSFVIKTPLLDFKVYGTKFNVEAYSNNEVNTTLVEGSLGVIGKRGNELARLVPGENANFKKGSADLIVENVDTQLFTSWKDGIVTFRNEKLKDIARKIERWYNVQIIINNEKLGEEVYMGTIMKNKPIDQLLEVFRLTSSLEYRIVSRADKPTLVYWE